MRLFTVFCSDSLALVTEWICTKERQRKEKKERKNNVNVNEIESVKLM